MLRQVEKQLTLLLITGSILFLDSAAVAESIQWQPLRDHVEIVRDGKYSTPRGNIEFNAIRFHLGYTRLRLVDVETAINSGRNVDDGIARTVDGGKEVAEILNYSLESIQKKFAAQTIALAPAGWSKSQRTIEHIGLLKIDGKTIHPFSELPVLSAIFCINDTARFPDYDAVVPVAYFAKSSSAISEAARACPNSVQVGPRIIEEGGKAGINQAELQSARYHRVIFAVDDPGRINLPPRSAEAGRNGYIVVTTNAVSLFDVQTMLLDKAFYALPSYKPHWAINLAGASHAGLVIAGGDAPMLVGNTQATIGSVLLIEASRK